MDKKDIYKLLELINYEPLNGENNVFFKKYSDHKNYKITLRINENNINRSY